jgi:hypothetical protein
VIARDAQDGTFPAAATAIVRKIGAHHMPRGKRLDSRTITLPVSGDT